MTVDVHERVVRLALPDFEALVAGELAVESVEPIEAILGMPEALAAVREPLLVGQVDVGVAAGVRTQFLWVGADALALLLPLDGARWQLMALPVDQLAASLVRITGLGPGTATGREARKLSDNPFRDLLVADDEVRREALVAHGFDVAWTLGVRSEDDEWLMAVCADEGGTWLLEPGEGEDFTATPVSSTTVFRRFSAIVPGLLG